MKPAAKRAKPAARLTTRSAAPSKKAPVKKAERAVRTLETVAPAGKRAAVLAGLRADEQRALQQALTGKATLLASSPRARDAAVFGAAAHLAQSPVLVASPRASELFEQARAIPGLDVVALLTAQPEAERTQARKRLLRGGSLLVVVEPAHLLDAALRQAALKAPLALLGVAAAHACSEHAHELSPAYLSLAEAASAFGAPVLATCTRTHSAVVEQAAAAIGAGKSGVVFVRDGGPKQAAQVVRSAERRAALQSAIQAYGAPGIVLTATAQEADAVLADLVARGIAAVRAHAGMAPAEREAAIAAFASAREPLVLITQSPHANASGLAGCPEASVGLGSAPPRADLKFLVHYQAPLSLEQHFEDSAWLPDGASSLVLADSSDAALVQAILAQQRIKPAAIEAMAQALAQPSAARSQPETLALRAGTSRRSAERVLFALAERNLIVRDSGQVARQAEPELLAAEGRLLSQRFAALRAADAGRAEAIARYVTSRHGSAPVAAQAEAAPARSLSLS